MRHWGRRKRSLLSLLVCYQEPDQLTLPVLSSPLPFLFSSSISASYFKHLPFIISMRSLFEFIVNILRKVTIEKSGEQHMLDLMHYLDGRHKFSTILSSVHSKIDLGNYQSLETLGAIILTMLTTMSLYSDLDVGILEIILETASRIFSSLDLNLDYNPIYLRDLISSNSLWRSKEIWLSIIQSRIDKAVLDLLSRIQPEEESCAAKRKESQIEELKKNIVFSILTENSTELSLMDIQPETGIDILIHYALLYNIESDKLLLVLSDFLASQTTHQDFNPSSKEMLLMKTEREKKCFEKYKTSQKFAIKMALKYIDSSKSLLNILLLNREFHTVFMRLIRKYILRFHCSELREKIWVNLIGSKPLSELFLKLSEGTTISSDVQKTITESSTRFFSTYSIKFKERISEIISCYSIYNPGLERSRSLYSVAAFVYRVVNDTPSTFGIISKIINDLDLFYFFKEEGRRINMYFYQLNRLISIFLPRLHSHFFAEGINCMHFASPWFLYIFTHIFSFTSTNEITEFPLIIFQEFSVSGFRAIFRIALFILHSFEDTLLRLPAAGIVSFLNELNSSTDFFRSSSTIESYQKLKFQFVITPQLIQKLNEEYSRICMISNEYKNTYKPEVLKNKQNY